MSNSLYKKVKLTWEYPMQPTSLKVGSVKIVRGTSPFTVETALGQTEIEFREYSPDFVEIYDTKELEEDTTYYYMIIVYGDTHPEILAATDLYTAYIPKNPIDPAKVKPMILSFQPGNNPLIYSTSPLKIDWGNWDTSQEQIYGATGRLRITEVEGNTVYIYDNLINSYEYMSNRIKITHEDGVSPIDWIWSRDLVIEQWYSEGYNRFYPGFETSGELTNGLGHKYIVPDTAPPKTKDLSYMFQNGSLMSDISSWNVSQVERMDYMFDNLQVAARIDLSKWCVTNITEEPQGFLSGEAASKIIKPVWGACPSYTVTPDTSSMILTGYTYSQEDPTYILSGTELDISCSNPSVTFTLDTESELSSLAKYVYTISSDLSNVTSEELYAAKFKVRPLSNSGQIQGFGCSMNFLYITQWWKDGYDGFNRQVGLGVNYIPEVEPPKTSNISYMFKFSYLSTMHTKHWDTSGFTNMTGLFMNRVHLYSDVSHWDVSNVTNMTDMFNTCNYYEKSLSNWNVGKVKSMDRMFYNVDYFMNYRNRYNPTHDNLSQWCVGNIYSLPVDFYGYGSLSESGFRSPVWGTCPRGEVEIEPLDPNIPDPNEVDAMVVTSANGYLYIYSTDFITVEALGDAQVSVNVQDGGSYKLTSVNPVGISSPVTFHIKPTVPGAKLPRVAFNYVTTVEQWYPKGYEGFNLMGMGGLGSSIERVPNKAPPNTTDLGYLFVRSEKFNQNISVWEVSSVENMDYMFNEAESFDQDLSGWCVSKIITKPAGFASYSPIDTEVSKQPVWGTCPSGILPDYDPNNIPPLDISQSMVYKGALDGVVSIIVLGDAKVDLGPYVEMKEVAGPYQLDANTTYMSYSARFSSEVDPNDIEVVITPNVDGAKMPLLMVSGFSEIKQWCPNGYVGFYSELIGDPLGIGDVVTKIPDSPPPNTTDFSGLFANTEFFNQDISSWDVREVTNMDYMFSGAEAFNQDISGWCVPNITAEPVDFSNDEVLLPSNKPVWGTCPNG